MGFALGVGVLRLASLGGRLRSDVRVSTAEERPMGGDSMDLSTEHFLWGQTVVGYLIALGVFVGAVLFGVLVVRPWTTPPR